MFDERQEWEKNFQNWKIEDGYQRFNNNSSTAIN